MDTLLAGHFRDTTLSNKARLTLSLEYLLLYIRDHVAPTREKVLTLIAYDPKDDRFTRLARCPLHSTGMSGTTALLRKDNCLAGQALKDGTVKHYGDVASEDAMRGGFNNDLGRPVTGSIVVVPIFGHDDQPLAVLCCTCKDRFAFAKGDVELLLFLSTKIFLAWTMFSDDYRPTGAVATDSTSVPAPDASKSTSLPDPRSDTSASERPSESGPDVLG